MICFLCQLYLSCRSKGGAATILPAKILFCFLDQNAFRDIQIVSTLLQIVCTLLQLACTLLQLADRHVTVLDRHITLFVRMMQVEQCKFEELWLSHTFAILCTRDDT